MKQLRPISLMWLLPAVLLALAAAPVAQAGHQDFGTDFALRLTQHRASVPLITENSYSQNRLNRSTPALAPSVPLITENSYSQNRLNRSTPALAPSVFHAATLTPDQKAACVSFTGGDGSTTSADVDTFIPAAPGHYNIGPKVIDSGAVGAFNFTSSRSSRRARRRVGCTAGSPL